jgi:adenosylhomocysteine nucleosidase
VNRIAIFAALHWECRAVLPQMRGVSRVHVGEFSAWRGTVARQDIWLIKTGVGLRRAAEAAHAMSSTAPFALFVSTGCAGALAPELAPGDVAVATTVIGTPPANCFAADIRQRQRAQQVAERAALRTTVAPVLCSPHVLATVAAKQGAATAHGAVAVEMEGTAIAERAAAAGIPFVSVRAIADAADTELPYAGRFIDPRNGTLKPLALAAYLATHPSGWTHLLALQRMMHAAQNSLEKFFAAWFAET